MHIGFLFNHYATHQVYHSAPVAYALSTRHPSIKISILCADQAQLETARRIGESMRPGHSCHFVELAVPRYAAVADKLFGNFIFVRKRAVLAANKDLFADLDVLVVTEVTSLALKRYPSLAHLKLVTIPHGVGDDRAVTFDNRVPEFDLVLVSGRKKRDRYIDEIGVVAEQISIVGCPKMEISEKQGDAPSRPLFPDEKPIVLYNPHYRRKESSWLKMGRLILDYFRDNKKFNLILAPHVILYLRKWRHGAFSLDRYQGFPNIHLDTGSSASVDLTYTRMADIYLGDVSSQVYEFLFLQPRPCLFLNPNRLNPRHWQGKGSNIFDFWKTGEVVESMDEFDKALNNAVANHEHYRAEQKRLVDYVYHAEEDRPPSALAADAIVQRFMRKDP